ncbi:hypothetical protein [Streptomyces olivaceus]
MPGPSTAPAEGSVRAYDVAGHDVRVTYDPEASRLEGDAEVAVRATADLARFDLDLAPTARSVDIDGKPARSFSRSGDGSVTVVPEEAIEEGRTFTVRVRYDGDPGRSNPSWARGEDGGVITVLAPVGTWFPGNADPDDTADFRLAATVPDGWTVVSGGRDRPVRRHGAGPPSTGAPRSPCPRRTRCSGSGSGTWSARGSPTGHRSPRSTRRAGKRSSRRTPTSSARSCRSSP